MGLFQLIPPHPHITNVAHHEWVRAPALCPVNETTITKTFFLRKILFTLSFILLIFNR